MASFSGGSGKGFTGGQKAGPDQEGTATAMPAFKAKWGTRELRVEIVSEGLDLAIGAASLVDYVSTALLLHHRLSIMEGRRADGGAQDKLDPKGLQGKRGARGERPNVRGFTGLPKALPHILTRNALSVSEGKRIGTQRASGPREAGKRSPTAGKFGTVARATIRPGHGKHTTFLIDEAALGNEYFFTTGEAARVIDTAVSGYLDGVLNGTRYYDKGKFTAQQKAGGG